MIIGASGGGSGILFIVVIAGLLIWLIVVRPQKKRQTQQQQIANELRIGDEVLTAGGIYGTVSGVADDEVTIQIAPKTEVRVARRAIAGVTRDPEEDEAAEAAEADEPQDDGDEKWQSAFDDEGSGDETSNEENRG